jgi:hypothetical protein
MFISFIDVQRRSYEKYKGQRKVKASERDSPKKLDLEFRSTYDIFKYKDIVLKFIDTRKWASGNI